MLTTGLGLDPDPQAQQELIHELDHAGVAALGIGVGVAFDRVPSALVEAARRHSFPIFVVPLATPFRDVISTVQRNVLSAEARSFHRLTTLQRYLMAALNDPSPTTAIIERLSAFVDADCALVGRDGLPLAGRCPVACQDVAEVLATTPAHPCRIESAGRVAWVVPVLASADVRTPTWLLSAPHTGAPEHVMLKSAAQMAASLIEAASRLEERRRLEERAVRRATMHALLDAEDIDERATAAVRACAWGLDVNAGVRVVVAGTRKAAPVAAEELLDLVESAVARLGVPWLATTRTGVVVLAVPAGVDDEVLGRTMLDVHPQLLAGVGRVVHEAADIRRSHTDGELGLRQVARSGGKRLLYYDDLDLVSVIVGEIEKDRVEDRIQRWLQPVIDNEIAYETLITYLDSDLDVGRTSKLLKLHPNSTRYRLARVEELLGSRLRRPSTIAALHFALLVRQDGSDRVHRKPAVRRELAAA